MAEQSESPDLTLQIQEVLSELKQQRHDVASLREEVRGNTTHVAAEVKRIKTEKDIKWKFVGNKEQYEVNVDLQDIVRQATWALENGKQIYCKELLNEAAEKLKKRNKLLRIAGTSPGGWDTVKCYETNPIASDSEDETKIYKAENRALKRKKPAGKVKKETPSNSGDKQAPSSSNVQPFLSMANMGSQPQYQQRTFRGYTGQQGAQGYGVGSAIPGPCFACGEFGHFRRECTKLNGQDFKGQVNTRK